MSDNRFDKDDYEYESFDNKRDFMDKIGEGFSSIFSRRSRKNDKADKDLVEFSKKGDDYELFVDETRQRKQQIKEEKAKASMPRAKKIKKPPTPLQDVSKILSHIVSLCR